MCETYILIEAYPDIEKLIEACIWKLQSYRSIHW